MSKMHFRIPAPSLRGRAGGEAENKYNSILKATSLLGGVQMINILLNLLRTKAIAILLGPSGVGLNGIYNETRELIHTTTNLGLDISGVRGISQAFEQNNAMEIDRQVRLLRTWVLLFALFGTLLCALIAQPLSQFTFKDNSHTWDFVFLSPAVGFSTITCGEMAVLKGLRQLKSLASLSIVNVVIAIVVSLPIYYVWGLSGVLPALVICTLLWAVAALAYGINAHSFGFFTKSKQLKGSNILLGIGITFVVCEIIDHIAKLYVQSYLNNNASLEMVGLYNSCRTMTLTYAGMVFSAMDQDYFPRLSGAVKNMLERTAILTKQLDVTLMIITPMLVAFIVIMPVIVPLLLSGEFNAIIPMAQIIAASLIFRAIYLPNAYLPLAAGDSKVYFSLNVIGALNTFWIILGYKLGGLIGMGVAMFGENLIDVLMVMFVSKWKYKISLPSKTKTMIILGCLFMLATYSLCCFLEGWLYWVAGAILIALSILYSLKNYKEA